MGERCTATTSKGKRCGSWAVKGCDHCRKHLTEDEQIKLGVIKTETPVEMELKGVSGITKKVTKPWNSDGNPWSRNLLRLQKRRPGFRCKFTNKEHWPSKRDQGWKIADIKDYGGVTDVVPGEEGKIDTVIRRREMFLIEIPEELALERDKFYAHKANAAMDAANRSAQEGNEAREISRSGHDPKIHSEFRTQRGGY